MIKPYLHWNPEIDASAFIAESADVIGRVKIGADSSIWYQAVLRGDVHDIEIGERSNIQDHSILHTSGGVSPCIVGNDVTVGHRVILHGCEIQDRCLIGMGSIIMDQAVLEEGCFLAAGSLVTERKILRGGYLYAGSPAKERRKLTPEEKEFLNRSARNYVEVSKNHGGS
ncbi:gamma carbonic anhydrase family protein [Mariprofundus sp. KV]|uniref:gamma carbonic anhydrase family protein n=1 Tax=Mariprofundus sp. KV TaxID=2608715 RepID=UPI0015A1B90E|nr:gamma carbonic anhydrase family protein [Mariprofundus sp. KV]NWF36818.1 gamma carbonic anhydrase family protein [Mariprofundus sp. KV]